MTTHLPTATDRGTESANSGAQISNGCGGAKLSADLIPVRVRFAFTVTHRGQLVPFFNVLDEGTPFGIESSITHESARGKGYRLEVVS